MHKGFVAAIAVTIIFFCSMSLANDMSSFEPKNLADVVEITAGRNTFKNFKKFKRIKIKKFKRNHHSMSFTALGKAVRIHWNKEKRKVYLNGKLVALNKIRHKRVFFKHYGQYQNELLDKLKSIVLPQAHANISQFFNQALNVILQSILQGMMTSVNNGGLNSLFNLVQQNPNNGFSPGETTTPLTPFRPGEDPGAVDPSNFFPESPTNDPASTSGNCPQNYTQSECDAVQLTNQARAQRGLPALRIESHCTRQAEASTDLMARTRRVSHDAFNSATRRRLGINLGNAAGENVAGGQRSAREVVNDWLNSPGHAANIFSRSFTTIGISRSGNYWAQCFGRK